MSDDAPSPDDAGDVQPTMEHAALPPDAAMPSSNGASAHAPAASVIPSDRPELVVGAAFAGGFALALFLRRLVR